MPTVRGVDREPGFGVVLRQLRLRAGLTQQALAERADISTDAIAALEVGRRTRPRIQTVRALADALSLGPTDRTRLWAALPDPERAPAGSVPDLPGPLVGRERDVAVVADLLIRPDVRLVTLTGVGGVGKTSLALAVAAGLQSRHEAGAVFVSLAPLRDARLVASTLLYALGLPESASREPRVQLVAYLRHRELLLVVDNFEHVLPAAPVLAELAASCPRLTQLVTSRSALRLRCERRIQVGPLETAAAVRMFEMRARAADDRFAQTARGVAATARVCQRLGGLPLAIELAAARARVLPPAELLPHLDRALHVLTGGPRDLPERQRTMRSTIDWSHRLLDPGAQRLFACLGVFDGGCTLAAVTAVHGPDGGLDPVDGLAALLDSSLLAEADADGERRFSMPEPVRLYACERFAELPDAATLRDRHARHYCGLAEAAAPAADGFGEPAWLSRLVGDRDNFRAALGWARERGDVELGLRLAAALSWYWIRSGSMSEGWGWLTGLLALADERTVPARLQARALAVAGRLGSYGTDIPGARRCFEASLALSRAAGDTAGTAHALQWVGTTALWGGDPDHAAQTARLEEALALHRAAGDRAGVQDALTNLSSAVLFKGDLDRGEALQREALALARELRSPYRIAGSCGILAFVTRLRGDRAEASALLREAAEHASLIGDAFLLISIAEGLAGLAVAGGRDERGATLFGAIASLREAMGTPRMPAVQAVLQVDIDAAQGTLGPDRFAAAWAAGSGMTLDQVVASALKG